MKHRLLFLWTICICLLVGCDFSIVQPQEVPYEFLQGADQIDSIEIVYRDHYDKSVEEEDFLVLKVLDASEYQTLIQAVTDLQGGYRVPPPSALGYYIVKITYQDGTKELVGSYGCGHITPDGKLESVTHFNYSFFDNEAFLNMISSFLGEDVTEPPYVE